VKRWVDYAAVMGAPHIRIFAGNAGKAPRAEAVKHALSAIEECCEYSGKKGIFLGLENHGGIVTEPRELIEVVKAVKSPWFGVNLDTGNFRTDDPYEDIAACAPYAVNVQIKAEIKRRGATASEPADLGRLSTILRDSGYQGYVALEYESAPDPWQAVPTWLARMKDAFARK
jgi:sugar phosphate isomerase/epimerase